MMFDHKKIKSLFKILIGSYLAVMIVPVLMTMMGAAGPAFAVIFILIGVGLAIFGVYFSWLLLNIFLDMHAKLSKLVGESDEGSDS